MNHISHLAFYGLLALAQARPDEGYNYPQPQTAFQLNQNQQSSSYQQNLPQINHISSQGQQLQLGQSQQSSSYQQSLPQLTQLSAPPAVQYGVPNLQSSQSSQIFSPQLNLQQQNQYLTPNLQVSQNSFSQQNAANLQLSQSSFAQQNVQQPQGFFPNFGSQSSLNQIPQAPLQQQVPQINQDALQYSLESQVPSVTKHIYVHVAPEEPHSSVQIISPPPVPRKSYKIIFIKAPQASLSQQELIHLNPALQPVEEKTLVYVLVDKSQQPDIVVPTSAPIQPSKPEVYFIKYKAQKNQGLQINSGESTSSLFSGGLPGAKYGPPGYQKRSANEKDIV